MTVGMCVMALMHAAQYLYDMQLHLWACVLVHCHVYKPCSGTFIGKAAMAQM